MIPRVFRLAAVALLCAPLLGIGEAPKPGDPLAAKLLAKHQAYVGWHAGDGVVKTLRETGTATRRGTVVANFDLLRYGTASRQSYVTEKGATYANGFTGSVAWRSNQNGFTVRTLGEAVRFEYDEDALFGEFTANGSFTATAGKHKTIDGVDTVALHLTSPIGLPMDAYVDPATGAYKTVVIDPDGNYQTTLEKLTYTESGTYRFLSGWKYLRSELTYAYTKIEPNAALTADELRPPKQTASWTFGDGTSPVEVTGHKWQRIYIDVTVNGVKGKFILDTGADGTYILDSFLRRAGATKFGEESVGSLYGTIKGNLFRVDSIGVGSSVLHNVIVNSGIDEDSFVSEGAVGLIGFDLLGGALVDLDLDRRMIGIMDPAKVEADESAGVPLNIDLSDGHIRVPMQLNGNTTVLATLDTGAPGLMLFSFEQDAKGTIGWAGQCGPLKSLELGPVNLQRPMGCRTGAFPKNEVLVGMDFLKHFNYTIDYHRNKMVMRRRTTEDK